MQALHLCYGVGALIVPLLAEPFLLQSENVDYDDVDPNAFSLQTNGVNETIEDIEFRSDLLDPANLKLVYPYSFVAGSLLFNAIYFFFLWKMWPNTEVHPSRKPASNFKDKSSKECNGNNHPNNSLKDVDKNERVVQEKKEDEHSYAMIPLSITPSSNMTALDTDSLNERSLKITRSNNSNEDHEQDRCEQFSHVIQYSKETQGSLVENGSCCREITLASTSLHSNDGIRISQEDEGTREGGGKKETLKQSDYEKMTKQYRFYKGFVIILTVMFMHIYYGLEITFGSFLTTFAYESDLHLKKSDGAHMTSLFWGTFTFFRVLTVFYIEYVSAETNILFSLMVVLAANVLLIPFGNTSELCLWIGVGLIGVGISSIWASLFGYLEEHFTVTSRIASGMIVSAIVGEFVFPLIISNFVAQYPQILLWVVLFCSISITILFLIMIAVMRLKMRWFRDEMPELTFQETSEKVH